MLRQGTSELPIFANGAVTGGFAYLFSNAGTESRFKENGVLKDQYWDEVVANSPRVSGAFTDAVVGLGDMASFGGTRAFRDFMGYGSVDYNSGWYAGGSAVGVFTSPSAAALRVTAYFGKSVRWLNQGRYWRIGPGLISRTAGAKPFNYGAGRDIPMLRIRNKTPSSLNHIDLRVLGR